ncbi:MAG: peroxide stress protein YaaA [Myxococcota bacterium]
MLVVISPAKKLDFSPSPPGLPATQPALEAETEILAESTRKLTTKKLEKLMSISTTLAELNRARFQEMSFPTTPDNGKQAALAFAGDTYLGLEATTLAPADLEWAQSHLAILSGLYGILRPLDLIQPYRLEMGSQLRTRRGKNLYAFWGKRLAARTNELTADHRDRTVINCASVEYWRGIRPELLSAGSITPVFRENKGDESKTIGFVAKRSRGMMARWIVQNRVETPEAIKDFREEDYVFQPRESTATEWVFTRASRTA